jgi:hypothetical protein
MAQDDLADNFDRHTRAAAATKETGALYNINVVDDQDRPFRFCGSGDFETYNPNRSKYITSYLKPLYGDHATKDNDFGYAWQHSYDYQWDGVRVLTLRC